MMTTMQHPGYQFGGMDSCAWSGYGSGADPSGHPHPASSISLPVLTSLASIPPGADSKALQQWYQYVPGHGLASVPRKDALFSCRYGSTPYHHPHSHPNTIARRNERERNRVKTINGTFAKLRQHLPCSSKTKKLSKVHILKSAIQYIDQLQHILDAQDNEVNKDNQSHATADSRDSFSSHMEDSRLTESGSLGSPVSDPSVGPCNMDTTVDSTVTDIASSPASTASELSERGSPDENESATSDRDLLEELVEWMQ